MNRQKPTAHKALLTALLVMMLCIVPAAADTLIIHTNDVHGRLTDNIGYDGLSAYIQERTAAGDEIILLDAGDAFQGKMEVNAFEGKSTLDIMNTLKYDAMAVGNHDFDFGEQSLAELTESAKFPLLAANVFLEDTKEKVFTDSVILTTSDYKIGVFGLTTPYTKTSTKKGNTDYLIFAKDEQLYEIAQQEVDTLKKQGCNFIICLGHMGLGDTYVPNSSKDIAEHVKGIDLFIDGHSHTELPGGITVGDTLIVSTGCYLKNIGVVTLKDGKITAELVTDYTKKDKKITALCDSYKQGLTEHLNAIIIGETKVNLDATAIPGCRTEETPFGDLTADTILYAAQLTGYEPDCAFINGGAIRASIPAGKITQLQVYNAFPFDDEIYVVTVPGSAILQTLERNTAATPAAEGGFPQVSGIEYTINTAKPYIEGEINRVTINTINGKPFNPDTTYKLATIDFIALGGNKYEALTTGKAENTEILDTVAFDLFISGKLDGLVDEQYAKPAGRIHIINTETTEKPTENVPDEPQQTTPAASPIPMLAILAGLAAGIIIAGNRR